MSNSSGMGAMGDTLGFIKQLWGGMNVPGMNMPGLSVPGMVMPTLSIEEINKQISDLKAVESWLTLNMNMLRGTIQALEVQSATLSTLKSMGESFAAAAKTASTPAPAQQESQAQAKARAERVPEPEPDIDDEDDEDDLDMPAEAPEAESTAAADAPSAAKPVKAAKTEAPIFGAEQMPNPALWWNMLQDQFKHAVSQAMTSESSAASTGAAPNKAPEPTAAKESKAPKKSAAASKREPVASARKATAKPAVKPKARGGKAS